MKVIIAGSRDIEDYDDLLQAVIVFEMEFGEITEVISGGARGPDKLGEKFAEYSGIHVERFIPDWKTFPGNAGFLRNSAMAEYAEALIALWDGKSNGTRDMIKKMRDKKVPVVVSNLSKIEIWT